jgi:hypothetical protein
MNTCLSVEVDRVPPVPFSVTNLGWGRWKLAGPTTAASRRDGFQILLQLQRHTINHLSTSSDLKFKTRKWRMNMSNDGI